ncbi:MAG: FKBP-type peptidyl-prolyl cis-trans isomerase [Saprospiraceae bacterium]
MKFIHTTLVLLSLCTFVLSCNKDDQGAQDEMLIKTYLTDNNLQAEKTSSGLYYIITLPGNTEHPSSSDNVHISYTGSLLNGNVFDSNPSATFPLGNLIEGMKEGISLLGKGGVATFYIPSGLGYGESPRQGIPANSVLIFDVTLIGF